MCHQCAQPHQAMYRLEEERAAAELLARRQKEELDALPFRIVGKSDDIITGEAPWEDDIETNYQSKFDKRDEPTYALLLHRD